MAQVASYVLQFQGTTAANPKAPEGDIWVDPDAAKEALPEQPQDSVSVVSDSTTVVMN